MNTKDIKYNIIFKQYKNRIFGYAIYMLKDKDDAEDAAQETLIRIWENLDRFNILAAKTWILKTTHNICIDIIRKRKRSYNFSMSLNENIEETIGDESTNSDPQKTTHLKLMSYKIKEHIENLPEQLKSVFVLYEMQGLKYNEISKVLDIPINSVKVYLLRARKKLQEGLKSYEAA